VSNPIFIDVPGYRFSVTNRKGDDSIVDVTIIEGRNAGYGFSSKISSGTFSPSDPSVQEQVIRFADEIRNSPSGYLD